MPEPARDRWAEWLLNRRFGGVERREEFIEGLILWRDRVLGNAGVGEGDVLLDFDERELLDLAEEAGFAETHLDYEAEISTAATCHGVTDWETFAKSAGNPNIPTIEEAMDEVLTPEEIARFTVHLRPLVENARRKSTSTLAFLRAVKGNPA